MKTSSCTQHHCVQSTSKLLKNRLRNKHQLAAQNDQDVESSLITLPSHTYSCRYICGMLLMRSGITVGAVTDCSLCSLESLSMLYWTAVDMAVVRCRWSLFRCFLWCSSHTTPNDYQPCHRNAVNPTSTCAATVMCVVVVGPNILIWKKPYFMDSCLTAYDFGVRHLASCMYSLVKSSNSAFCVI